MEVPIIWKLQVEGADRVKSAMNDLNSALERGEITNEEYTKSLMALGRESGRLNNLSRTQTQIFLAMHPNINRLTRGFSTFASVSRSALSIANSINLAFLRGGQASSEVLDITAQIAELRREMERAPADEKQGINEQIAILEARLKELKNAEVMGAISDVITAIGSIGLAISQTIPLVVKLIAKLTAAKAISSSINLSPTGGLVPGVGGKGGGFGVGGAIGGAATGVAIGAAVFPSIDAWLKENNEGYAKWAEFRDTVMGPAINDFFMKTIPETITKGFTTAWNGALTITQNVVNGIITGIEKLVNSFISAINSMIDAYNKTAGKIFGQLGKLGTVSLPRINLNEYMIKSNEVGSPAGSPAKGQIGPTNNYITVQGSVITERQLMSLVDDKFKEWMKSRGFTGFQ